jgi:predicted glycoside hydrolase/deacetylase ChbG (UPF0249 family)
VSAGARPSARVVLCADDFAMSAGISRAILDLIGMGRLSATSAMTTSPLWPQHAVDLRRVAGPVGCGLHVNLTSGKPLGAMPVLAPAGRLPPLAMVLRRSLMGRLPREEIAAEIERQLDAFEDHVGRLPDFVDGHQHVHVLPGVRGPLIAVLVRRGLCGRLWLRDPSDAVAAILRRPSAPKALLIKALALGFASMASRAGFATNRGFSGYSDFSAGRDLGNDFNAFLRRLGPNPLVMCHPGQAEAEEAVLDGVVESRPREFGYLASGDFARLLAQRRIALVPSPS